MGMQNGAGPPFVLEREAQGFGLEWPGFNPALWEESHPRLRNIYGIFILTNTKDVWLNKTGLDTVEEERYACCSVEKSTF